jgi:hypothetical protein
MSMLDILGRLLSGTKPEVVTPATAPIISDILVECYLWAAKEKKTEAQERTTESVNGKQNSSKIQDHNLKTDKREPSIEPIGQSPFTASKLRYGNRNVA